MRLNSEHRIPNEINICIRVYSGLRFRATRSDQKILPCSNKNRRFMGMREWCYLAIII